MRDFFCTLSICFLTIAGLLLILWTAMILTVSPVAAATQCGSRLFVVEQLATRFGESRHAIGLAANNMVMELFVNGESQSWTITVSTAEGETCLLASGQGFEVLNEALPKSGAPL